MPQAEEGKKKHLPSPWGPPCRGEAGRKRTDQRSGLRAQGVGPPPPGTQGGNTGFFPAWERLPLTSIQRQSSGRRSNTENGRLSGKLRGKGRSVFGQCIYGLYPRIYVISKQRADSVSGVKNQFKQ